MAIRRLGRIASAAFSLTSRDGRRARAVCVDFSADGKRLVAIATGGRSRWATLQVGGGPVRLRMLAPQAAAPRRTSTRPATKVVSASGDARRTSGTGRRPTITLPHPDDVLNAAFSPDGRLVATAARRRLRADLGCGERAQANGASAGGAVGTVRFDERRAARSSARRADGVVRVSSVDGGPPLDEMRGDGPGNDAAFVPGTDEVVSVDEDGTLRTWSVLRVDQPSRQRARAEQAAERTAATAGASRAPTTTARSASPTCTCGIPSPGASWS